MPVRWVIWLISSFIACSSSFLQSAMALRYAAPDEAFETHESTTRHILCQPLRSCVQKSHTPSANGWRARLWRRAFRRLHAALADLLAQGAFALDTEVVIEGEEGGNQHLRACQQRPPVDDEKEPDARDHQQHGSGGYRHSEQEQKRPDEAQNGAAQAQPAMRGVGVQPDDALKAGGGRVEEVDPQGSGSANDPKHKHNKTINNLHLCSPRQVRKCLRAFAVHTARRGKL